MIKKQQNTINSLNTKDQVTKRILDNNALNQLNLLSWLILCSSNFMLRQRFYKQTQISKYGQVLNYMFPDSKLIRRSIFFLNNKKTSKVGSLPLKNLRVSAGQNMSTH